ncbi:hypothetical protein [Nocardia sp. NPDC050793]|uniref:hypothetical protein n=1 Tax=Nocardia sp. NPDC050793 TaxID=3155159 RepID=UPI0033C94286
MSAGLINTEALEDLVRQVAGRATVDRDLLRQLIREELPEPAISFDLKGAIAYTGLSKWRLETLAREEKIITRKEGAKTLYMRESLDRYIRSLPTWGEA